MKPRVHELKTWPEPFAAVVDGRKTFEYRRDDRGFAVGDVLLLREFEPTRWGRYTGRVARVRVTYVLHGGRFGVPEHFAVLGVEALAEPAAEEVERG